MTGILITITICIVFFFVVYVLIKVTGNDLYSHYEKRGISKQHNYKYFRIKLKTFQSGKQSYVIDAYENKLDLFLGLNLRLEKEYDNIKDSENRIASFKRQRLIKETKVK